MNTKEMKQKWLEALRSGEYKQTKGTLKGVNEDGEVGYCCLGVFLSAVLEDEPPKAYLEEGYETYADEGPQEMYNKTMSILGEGIQQAGIDMNDFGKSFVEIADMIEKEWMV